MLTISKHSLTGRQRPLLNQFHKSSVYCSARCIKTAPLQLRSYSLQNQSCEKSVELVAEGVESVYGWAKRNRLIKTQMCSREVTPSLKTKKDNAKLFQAYVGVVWSIVFGF